MIFSHLRNSAKYSTPFVAYSDNYNMTELWLIKMLTRGEAVDLGLFALKVKWTIQL